MTTARLTEQNALPEWAVHQYTQLVHAITNGRAQIIDTQRLSDGNKVFAICGVSELSDGQWELLPLAVLVADPDGELVPPWADSEQ